MVDPTRRFWLRGKAAQPALRPPWSLRPESAFTSACTRCGDCVAVCPPRVIRKGDGGFPVLDFFDAGCDFCGACAAACVPKALDRRLPMDRPIAGRLQIGPSCLAERRIECRVCGDACGAGALRFPPRAGAVAAPVLDAARCTACGDCQARCPAGALTVVPGGAPLKA